MADFVSASLKRFKAGEWYKQENFIEDMRKHYDFLKKRNANPFLLKVVEIEVKGGPCPECGEPYKKKHVYHNKKLKSGGHRREDYYTHEEQCKCFEKKLYPEKFTEDERLLMESGVPIKYHTANFEDWDYGNNNSLNEAMKKVRYYAEKDNWKGLKGRGVLSLGNPGRGKTRCSVALLKHIMKNSSLRVIYEQCASTQDRIINNNGKSYHQHILSHDVIFLDDLDKANLKNDFIRNEFFSIIDGATNRMKIVIITTNIPTYEEMEKVFGSAITSRLSEFKIVKFKEGDDYREIKALREHERSEDE